MADDKFKRELHLDATQAFEELDKLNKKMDELTKKTGKSSELNIGEESLKETKTQLQIVLDKTKNFTQRLEVAFDILQKFNSLSKSGAGMAQGFEKLDDATKSASESIKTLKGELTKNLEDLKKLGGTAKSGSEDQLRYFEAINRAQLALTKSIHDTGQEYTGLNTELNTLLGSLKKSEERFKQQKFGTDKFEEAKTEVDNLITKLKTLEQTIKETSGVGGSLKLQDALKTIQTTVSKSQGLISEESVQKKRKTDIRDDLQEKLSRVRETYKTAKNDIQAHGSVLEDTRDKFNKYTNDLQQFATANKEVIGNTAKHEQIIRALTLNLKNLETETNKQEKDYKSLATATRELGSASELLSKQQKAVAMGGVGGIQKEHVDQTTNSVEELLETVRRLKKESGLPAKAGLISRASSAELKGEMSLAGIGVNKGIRPEQIAAGLKKEYEQIREELKSVTQGTEEWVNKNTKLQELEAHLKDIHAILMKAGQTGDPMGIKKLIAQTQNMKLGIDPVAKFNTELKNLTTQYDKLSTAAAKYNKESMQWKSIAAAASAMAPKIQAMATTGKEQEGTRTQALLAQAALDKEFGMTAKKPVVQVDMTEKNIKTKIAEYNQLIAASRKLRESMGVDSQQYIDSRNKAAAMRKELVALRDTLMSVRPASIQITRANASLAKSFDEATKKQIGLIGQISRARTLLITAIAGYYTLNQTVTALKSVFIDTADKLKNLEISQAGAFNNIYAENFGKSLERSRGFIKQLLADSVKLNVSFQTLQEVTTATMPMFLRQGFSESQARSMIARMTKMAEMMFPTQAAFQATSETRALLGQSPLSRAQIVQSLGITSAGQLKGLQAQGPEAFAKFFEQASSGVEKAGKESLDTVAAQVRLLGNNFLVLSQTISKDVYQSVLKFLKELNEGFKTDKFNSVILFIQKIGATLGWLIDKVLSPAVMNLDKVIRPIEKLTPVVQGLGKAIEALIYVLPTLLSMLNTLIPVIIAMAATKTVGMAGQAVGAGKDAILAILSAAEAKLALSRTAVTTATIAEKVAEEAIVVAKTEATAATVAANTATTGTTTAATGLVAAFNKVNIAITLVVLGLASLYKIFNDLNNFFKQKAMLSEMDYQQGMAQASLSMAELTLGKTKKMTPEERNALSQTEKDINKNVYNQALKDTRAAIKDLEKMTPESPEQKSTIDNTIKQLNNRMSQLMTDYGGIIDEQSMKLSQKAAQLYKDWAPEVAHRKFSEELNRTYDAMAAWREKIEKLKEKLEVLKREEPTLQATKAGLTEKISYMEKGLKKEPGKIYREFGGVENTQKVLREAKKELSATEASLTDITNTEKTITALNNRLVNTEQEIAKAKVDTLQLEIDEQDLLLKMAKSGEEKLKILEKKRALNEESNRVEEEAYVLAATNTEAIKKLKQQIKDLNKELQMPTTTEERKVVIKKQIAAKETKILKAEEKAHGEFTGVEKVDAVKAKAIRQKISAVDVELVKPGITKEQTVELTKKKNELLEEEKKLTQKEVDLSGQGIANKRKNYELEQEYQQTQETQLKEKNSELEEWRKIGDMYRSAGKDPANMEGYVARFNLLQEDLKKVAGSYSEVLKNNDELNRQTMDNLAAGINVAINLEGYINQMKTDVETKMSEIDISAERKKIRLGAAYAGSGVAAPYQEKGNIQIDRQATLQKIQVQRESLAGLTEKRRGLEAESHTTMSAFNTKRNAKELAEVYKEEINVTKAIDKLNLELEVNTAEFQKNAQAIRETAQAIDIMNQKHEITMRSIEKSGEFEQGFAKLDMASREVQHGVETGEVPELAGIRAEKSLGLDRVQMEVDQSLTDINTSVEEAMVDKQAALAKNIASEQALYKNAANNNEEINQEALDGILSERADMQNEMLNMEEEAEQKRTNIIEMGLLRQQALEQDAAYKKEAIWQKYYEEVRKYDEEFAAQVTAFKKEQNTINIPTQETRGGIIDIAREGILKEMAGLKDDNKIMSDLAKSIWGNAIAEGDRLRESLRDLSLPTKDITPPGMKQARERPWEVMTPEDSIKVAQMQIEKAINDFQKNVVGKFSVQFGELGTALGKVTNLVDLQKVVDGLNQFKNKMGELQNLADYYGVDIQNIVDAIADFEKAIEERRKEIQKIIFETEHAIRQEITSLRQATLPEREGYKTGLSLVSDVKGLLEQGMDKNLIKELVYTRAQNLIDQTNEQIKSIQKQINEGYENEKGELVSLSEGLQIDISKVIEEVKKNLDNIRSSYNETALGIINQDRDVATLRPEEDRKRQLAKLAQKQQKEEGKITEQGETDITRFKNRYQREIDKLNEEQIILVQTLQKALEALQVELDWLLGNIRPPEIPPIKPPNITGGGQTGMATIPGGGVIGGGNNNISIGGGGIGPVYIPPSTPGDSGIGGGRSGSGGSGGGSSNGGGNGRGGTDNQSTEHDDSGESDWMVDEDGYLYYIDENGQRVYDSPSGAANYNNKHGKKKKGGGTITPGGGGTKKEPSTPEKKVTKADTGLYGRIQDAYDKYLKTGMFATTGPVSNSKEANQWLNAHAAEHYGAAEGAWELPQDMVANVHKGEMIIPQRFAEALRGNITNNSSNSKNEVLNVNIYKTDEAHILNQVRKAIRESQKTTNMAGS